MGGMRSTQPFSRRKPTDATRLQANQEADWDPAGSDRYLLACETALDGMYSGGAL